MGDRRTFLIEHSFSSKYSGCDNRWHHVHLQIIKDQINLRVDTVDHKYFLSDNGHFTSARTSSPLYIGGLPGEWCAANFKILNTWAFLPSEQSFPNKNLDQGFIIIFHFYKSTTYLFHNSLSFYQKKKKYCCIVIISDLVMKLQCYWTLTEIHQNSKPLH